MFTVTFAPIHPVMKRMTTRVAHVQVFFSTLVSPCFDLPSRLAGKRRRLGFLPVRNPEPIVQRCWDAYDADHG